MEGSLTNGEAGFVAIEGVEAAETATAELIEWWLNGQSGQGMEQFCLGCRRLFVLMARRQEAYGCFAATLLLF